MKCYECLGKPNTTLNRNCNTSFWYSIPILKPKRGSKAKFNILKLRLNKSQRCFNGRCIVISLRALKLINSYLIWSCSSLPQHSNYVRALIIYDASLSTTLSLFGDCQILANWDRYDHDSFCINMLALVSKILSLMTETVASW